ncbi:MAG: methyltransferase domain-containing protein [Vicinamibacterales bacterium]
MENAESDAGATSPSHRPPPAAPDRSQIERLNTLWAIIDAPSQGGTLRGRFAAIVRRLLSRVLARQQEFNAVVVDHINRNAEFMDDISRRHLDDVVDEMRRHREALLARERRSDASVAVVAAAQEELRTAVGVLQQATQNLKRELSRLGTDQGSTPRGPISALTPAGPTPDDRNAVSGGHPSVPPLPGPSSQFDTLDSHKYVGFEDHFRGSADDIRARVAEYLPTFAGASDVLDIGCGRGEFLALLRERGITARGIDLNPAMVEVCREQTLDAVVADALGYLRSLPDGSLGGLFAAQVVEHLEPRYLTQLIDAAFDKLRPGAPIVLETINPACWFAFFESYIRDITHVRALHPDTLKYLLVSSGFQHAEIRYRAPYPENEKLQPVPAGAPAGASPDAAVVADWAETINANVERVNRLLFTWLDYAAIGRRP